MHQECSPFLGSCKKGDGFLSGTYTVLFSAQISTVQVKGAGTRVLRTDVFLGQDNPSRDAHLNSQKGDVSAMEIHPGRLCALTWAG